MEDEDVPLGNILTPSSKIADIVGGQLPKYIFTQHSKGQEFRFKSFGDFQTIPKALDGEEYLSEDTSSPESPSPPQSILNSVILGEWEDRYKQGMFRYRIEDCLSRMVPGRYGFIAQFNEGRGSKKRATEFSVDKVAQPFDGSKFNFLKAQQKEVLFQLEPSEARSVKNVSKYFQSAGVKDDAHLVLINVSPIEYGHILLVPRCTAQLPQVVDPEAALAAIQMAVEADSPYFRVGYNSLGAYGTINHLHFQAYYMSLPFPVERATTKPLPFAPACSPDDVSITQLDDYPVRGIVFQQASSTVALAAALGRACQKLVAMNQPHNFLICDAGTRAFLWPQCYAEKQAQGIVPQDLLDTQVNPACFEVAGHMVMKRKEDYDNMTQADAWRLLAQVSLEEDRFLATAKSCLE